MSSVYVPVVKMMVQKFESEGGFSTAALATAAAFAYVANGLNRFPFPVTSLPLTDT